MSDPIITIPNPQEDQSWVEIVDQILAELAPSDPPKDVVRMVELLISGYSIAETADAIEVHPDTVRRWLQRYPSATAAVKMGKSLLSRWRLNQIDRQFLLALKKSEEILQTSLTDSAVNPKVLSALGQHVRAILTMVQGTKVDVRVTHELGDTVLATRREALDYLAERIKDTPFIEGEIKPSKGGPLLTAGGEPNFGTMGRFDINEDGVQCHICGKRYRNLAGHINTRHQLTIADYELTYLLEPGSVSQTSMR